ncbi:MULTISPECIES: hypothetical protein [unclassified Nocardia]|uniref:hypothetical protein n=1 Tax=unclassified Nocardia TaxID=2637762 RepID=UPI001CE4ABD8|nr:MULTISPECIES: hypothetical protein [unclassified Nocardia]
MLHTVLIYLHAAFGVASFGTGIAALRRGALCPSHLWTLIGTIVFLALPIAGEWSKLDGTAQTLYSAFLVLGFYMIWRSTEACRVRPARGGAPSREYVSHLGFNLIALFDAFVVILVLDLGGPVWLIVTVGVLVAAAGHPVRRRLEHRLAPAGTPQPSADRSE